MPQLTLKHCTIADVQMDAEQEFKRVVKININEEDFFDMLDNVNPKSIIKYLDMRNIPHREAINITFRHSQNSGMRRKDKRKLERLESISQNIIKMDKQWKW